MLELNTKLKLDKDTIESPNLCERFTKEELDKIGEYVWDGYNRDEQSRVDWFRRSQAGMDLAMQIQKPKSFPWPNCSNVAFPVVTIASMQFHARAYTTLINGVDVVKARVIGPDPNGNKQKRADRISCHMSYQCLEEDTAWEEQHDRSFLILPIEGCVFFKSYHSASKGYTVSELVRAKDLVLNYYSKSTDTAPRKTHIIPLYRNDLYERVKRGVFRADLLDESWYKSPAVVLVQTQDQRDRRTGQTPPQTPDQDTPFTMLEQHVNMDLDQDGYAEPYIVTIESNSKYVARIVTAFDREEDIERSGGEILSIKPAHMFTKIPFIPSPDGGIYDMGFGVLLGPLNESVNSLINQLIDAGTLATTAGGFLGRGAKIRGGVYTFSPFQWNRVDSTGDDLRKNMVPLDVREPSMVLFQLLSLLINYANRIPGTTDTMVGENPGQNTPIPNMQEMVTQGMQIYNNLFKRVWRGMKDEFKLRYVLNARYLSVSKTTFGQGGLYISREDYLGNPGEVAPAADPNMVSKGDKIRQAAAMKQSAASTPGYDVEYVERNFLRALGVEDVDRAYPGMKKFPPGKDAKLLLGEMKLKGEQMKMQSALYAEVLTLAETKRLNTAKILELETKAAKNVADIGTDKAELIIATMQTAIGALKQHNDILDKRVERLLEMMTNVSGTSEGDVGAGEDGSGGLPAMDGASGDEALGEGMPEEAPVS